MATKTVTVKLTEVEIRLLDGLVSNYHYLSRSDALRIALVAYAETKKLKPGALAQLREARKNHPIRRRKLQ